MDTKDFIRNLKLSKNSFVFPDKALLEDGELDMGYLSALHELLASGVFRQETEQSGFRLLETILDESSSVEEIMACRKALRLVLGRLDAMETMDKAYQEELLRIVPGHEEENASRLDS